MKYTDEEIKSLSTVLKERITKAEEVCALIDKRRAEASKKLGLILNDVYRGNIKLKLHVDWLSSINDYRIGSTKSQWNLTITEMFQSIVNELKDELEIDFVTPATNKEVVIEVSGNYVKFELLYKFTTARLICKKKICDNLYSYEEATLSSTALADTFSCEELEELKEKVNDYFDSFIEFLDMLTVFVVSKWKTDII